MRRPVLVIAVIVVSLLGACTSPDAQAGRSLEVVASFYPLAEAASAVGGNLASVQNLTPPGVDPHDLELAPDDLETLLTADVVLFVGAGFQPAVEDGVADADGVVVDVLEGIPTLPPPDAAGEEGAADPHVWLDPMLYAKIVLRLAEAMAGASPADEEAFHANAETYVEQLETIDAEFAEGLEPCRGRTMVVAHAAFGYLAAAYGLKQQAITGVSPEAEPSPDRLAELRDLVEREGVTTIFTETLASPEVAETLASEAGVRTAVLDPLEGLTPEQLEAGEDYASVIRENLETLRSGLGCA